LGTQPGSKTYLRYPGGQLLTRPSGTLECWVYLRDYTLFSIRQLSYIGACQGDVGGLSVTPSGRLELTLWYASTASFTIDSGAVVLPLNTWTHVAMTWGSAGTKLYVNGGEVVSHSNTAGFADWNSQNSVFVFLAEGSYIDEFRVSSIQRTSFNLPSTDLTLTLNMFAGVKIDGPVGTPVSVQSTPSLGPINWVTITNFVLPSQPFILIDYRTPTNPGQFYRVLRTSQ